jgi:sterol 3beta-glucosyltransferase
VSRALLARAAEGLRGERLDNSYQPSWARQVHALGVGPSPVPFQTLTAERLAEAIHEAVTNPALRQRAAELSRRIQAEDGLGRTIEIFLRYADRWGHVR